MIHDGGKDNKNHKINNVQEIKHLSEIKTRSGNKNNKMGLTTILISWSYKKRREMEQHIPSAMEMWNIVAKTKSGKPVTQPLHQFQFETVRSWLTWLVTEWIKPGLTSKLSINQMGWFFFSLSFYNLFMLGYFFIQPPYKWDPIYQLAISPDRLLLRILLLWSGLSRSPSLEMTKQ